MISELTLDNSKYQGVKRCLREEFPSVRPGHLSGALAAALGFRNDDALQCALEDLSELHVIPDRDMFIAHLCELGYSGEDIVPRSGRPELPRLAGWLVPAQV
jgi:hypothetical protein